MNDHRFDSTSDSFPGQTNRRKFTLKILGLGTGAVAIVVARLPATNPHRQNTLTRTIGQSPEPECLEIGARCDSSSDCCSQCCVSYAGTAALCALLDTCSMPERPEPGESAADLRDRGSAAAPRP